MILDDPYRCSFRPSCDLLCEEGGCDWMDFPELPPEEEAEQKERKMSWRKFPNNETGMIPFYFETWHLTLAYWTAEEGLRGDFSAVLSALGLIGMDERYTECF